ncbi:IS66-like element accessory protein TnpA, partial [Aestuariispira insulae]
MTDARKRGRQWSMAAKKQIVREAAHPGISVRAVADRHNVDPSQIYDWRRKFPDAAVDPEPVREDVADFLPVEIGPGLSPGGSTPLYNMSITLAGGHQVMAGRDVSPALMGAVLEMLARR